MSDSSTDNEGAPQGSAGEDKTLVGSTDIGSAPDDSQGDKAASPPAENKDANNSGSMLEAVQAALAKGKEQSSGSGEGEGGEPKADAALKEGAQPKPGEEEAEGELTEDELKSYKPKTQARMRKLLAANQALSAQSATLEHEAKGFRAMQGYAKDANLEAKEINTGLELMRLMKNDPVKCFEQLTPIYQQLSALVGAVIPKDLADQVRAGAITEPAARELSQLRAARGVEANIAAERTERERQNRANSERQQAETRFQDEVATGISKWENAWRKSDPDYSLKQSHVQKAIELELLRRIQSKTLPQNVEGIIKMADEVKQSAEKELKLLMPKKNTPITNVNGNGSSSGSKPAPTSMLDVVRQASGQF